MARQPKWYFAAYQLLSSGIDDVDAFLLKALHEAPILTRDGYEWGFSDIDEVVFEDEEYLFGYLYKNKPRSERSKIERTERITISEPLEDDLIARAAFFLHPQHIIAFHPQPNDITHVRFGNMFSELVERTSDIGFVKLYFNFVTDTKDIFRAIRDFAVVEKLEIDLILPNPRMSPRYNAVSKDIEDIRARQYHQRFEAGPEGTLAISEDSRAHRSIEMATDGFGIAKLEGRDEEGALIRARTKEYPATMYAPSLETTPKEEVLKVLGKKFREIMRRGGQSVS